MSLNSISEWSLDNLPWDQLHELLDTCYPRPPRDVFPRVVSSTHRSQRVWLAMDGTNLSGVVMLSPHTKGGHLDNLAVAPSARSRGVAKGLVCTLLDSVSSDGPAIVTLTTRIQSFFTPFGFQSCGQLKDGSTAMFLLLSGPENSSPLPL